MLSASQAMLAEAYRPSQECKTVSSPCSTSGLLLATMRSGCTTGSCETMDCSPWEGTESADAQARTCGAWGWGSCDGCPWEGLAAWPFLVETCTTHFVDNNHR